MVGTDEELGQFTSSCVYIGHFDASTREISKNSRSSVVRMKLIGLTGGIGSGKTTVSSALKERGANVIDADAIVHELQQRGTIVFNEMVEQFGREIVGADGELDRQRVADIVFNDPDALGALNAIVHPRVGAEIARRLEEAAQRGDTVILDVPLLVESGRNDMAGLIVVDLDPDVAVERLVAFRGFSESDARARIARQASREDRLEKADFVVDNQGTLEELHRRIDQLWQWIEDLRVS